MQSLVSPSGENCCPQCLIHVSSPRSEFRKLTPVGGHSVKKTRQRGFRGRKMKWRKNGGEGEEGTKEQEEKCSRRRTKEHEKIDGWRSNIRSRPAQSQLYGSGKGPCKSHAQMNPWFDYWTWGTSGSWVRMRWEITGLIPIHLQGLSVHISIHLSLLTIVVEEELKKVRVGGPASHENPGAHVQVCQAPPALGHTPLCGERTSHQRKVILYVKSLLLLLEKGMAHFHCGWKGRDPRVLPPALYPLCFMSPG